jgi:hypothetical protein
MPQMVRESAYALALHLSGRISIDDFAKMSASSGAAIDKEFMASLCAVSSSPKL